jgi:ribosome biogenesis protein BRX1
MGILKRRLKQQEEAEDLVQNELFEGESLGESSTSEEEESLSGEDMDEQVVETRPSKKKVMVLASRGINARQRHLLDDLCSLMPHGKKEVKFDTKRELFALNELAELNSCDHVLFFEARKPQELFIWAAKSPSGPSVRFHVQNIHTLEELHLTGNCMKGARPILTFDPTFGETDEGQTIKELLSAMFGVPKDHRKTRPFVDRVMHFGWADDRVWIRNYQIKEGTATEESIDGLSLEEIGPRFVLHPVRILEGSFVGRTRWQNSNYVSAGAIRAYVRENLAMKHKQRARDQEATAYRKKNAVLPDNELDHVFD